MRGARDTRRAVMLRLSTKGNMPTLNFCNAALPPPASELSLEPCQRRLRILVVDDEPSIRDILSAYLRGDGHFVETAVDGLDGLEHFRRGTWDVVLTDRAMPGLSGWQLAAEIKAIAPCLPIVMLSGFASGLLEESGQLKTVDLLMHKPFRLEELREAVQKAVRLYPASPTLLARPEDQGERATG